MPLHDWSRAPDNVFHAFHVAWLTGLMRALNRGVLPDGYLARTEEYVGPFQADVLALELGAPPPAADVRASVALEPTARIAPPRFGVGRQRRVTVFSARDERRVAVIEVVSPGNKDSDPRARWFEAKLVELLAAGLHVLVLDLLPATRPAPGLAAAVARELGSEGAAPREGRCATSFERSVEPDEVRLYHTRLALAQPLPPVPLFLAPGLHVDVPLEASYAEAYAALPGPDQERLEA